MSDIPVLSIVLAVALAVLINLIINLIMRRRDKNSRTVKMVNDQIQAFRNEVSATVERITTLGRDTLQNVEAKTGEASDMVRQVAEGLETLSEHSRDLAALQSVCVSYKNALEKLRGATEQAEARIQAVQDEVRKAEEVDDFVRAFQAESDRLTNQMQDLKTEYVQLIASTEESLRAASENQKNANQDMLQEFSVSLERFREQFSDFVASERSGFESFVSEEARKAEASAADIESRRQEILTSLDAGRAGLEAMLSSIDSDLGRIRTSSEEIKGDIAAATEAFKTDTDSAKSALSLHAEDCRAEISKSFEELRTELEELSQTQADDIERRKALLSDDADAIVSKVSGEIDGRKNELSAFADNALQSFTSSVKSKEEELDGILSSFAARIQANEAELASMLDGIRQGAGETESNVKLVIEEALSRIADAREGLDADRNSFVISSHDVIARSFDEILASLDDSFAKMKGDGESFIKNLSDRVSDTRETIAMLSEGEQSRIKTAVERLQELDGKIRMSEEQLAALSEQITSTREELFSVQQDRGRLDADIEERNKELERLKSDMEEQKALRINEEAALVRLKLQISNLKKETKSPEKKEEAKKKPEDMIDEFPDDIFTGSVEEVDLSDDEE